MSSLNIICLQIFYQINALLRRYYLNQTFNHIRNTIKFLIWPGVLLIIALIILVDFDVEPQTGDKIGYESSISTFCIFLLSFHIWSFTEWLVLDKTSDIKSLMFSMGLKKSSYYIGNAFIFIFLIVGPLILVVLVITKKYIFIDGNNSIILLSLLYALFTIQLTGFVFALSSMITSDNFLIFIPIAILLQLPVHMIVKLISIEAGNSFIILTVFVALMSPFEALKIYGDSYVYSKNYSNSTYYRYNEDLINASTLFLLTIMAFWSIVYFVFAYWNAEVREQSKQDKSEEHTNQVSFCQHLYSFIIQLKYLFTKNQEQNDISVIYNSKLVDFNDEKFSQVGSKNNDKFFEKEQSRTLDTIEIQLNNVSKAFDKTLAIDNVNLNIYKREITALYGHNKSTKTGKTTLINLILNRLKPQKGYIVFNNNNNGNKINNFNNQTQNKTSQNNNNINIGFCPQKSVLDPKLTVKQHLDLFIDIKLPGLPFIERKCNIMNTLEDLKLYRHVKMNPSQLTNTMIRKLSLAIAFVGKSELIILDEPTTGLDNDSKIFIWNFINKCKKNRTILFTTQQILEADYLADRIAIMSEGKIISSGSSLFLNNIFAGNGYKLFIECLINKQELILNIIKEYFSKAKKLNLSKKFISPKSSMSIDDDNDNDRHGYDYDKTVVEILIELVDNEKDKDELEISIINLLGFIENNPSDLHGIRSYNLKCSTIEDAIMSNYFTSSVFSKSSPPTAQADQIENIELKQEQETIHNIVDIILKPVKADNSNFKDTQKALLYAFLIKHLQTYRNNLKSIIFFRLILTLFLVIVISFEYHFKFATKYYSPAFINAFLIVHFIMNPTIEKESKFKIIQLTSEANIILYWLSQLLVDLLSVFILIIYFNCAFAIVILYNGQYLVNSYLVHFILTLTILLFGISASLIAYTLSVLILTKPIACMGYSLVLYWISSFVHMITGPIKLEMFIFIQDVFNSLFILILPTDAFQYIRHCFISRCYVKVFGITSNVCPTRMNTVGPIVFGIGSLIFQIILYATILYLIECKGYFRIGKARRKLVYNRNSIKTNQDIVTSDQDVIEESAKASMAIKNINDKTTNRESVYSLIVSDLGKYKIIDNLSFTIKQRECFGLIGIDESEKRTLFSILTGEIMPDSGQLWCNNYLEREYYMKNNFAYVPQLNPITHLTPQQALRFIAKLKRIHDDNIDLQVESMLKLFNLQDYKDKSAFSLRGGMKRKLTLAMCLIGAPSFIALDEPTVGIDISSRNNLWFLLKMLRKKRNASILLSSKELKDVELVCDRIGIMSNGTMQYIGTFFNLNKKFNSNGCQLKVYFIQTDKDLIEQLLCELRDLLQFEIIDSAINTAASTSQSQHKNQRYEKKLSYKSILNGAIFEFPTDDNNGSLFSRAKLLRTLRNFRLNQKMEIKDKMFYIIYDYSLEDLISTLSRSEENNKHNNQISEHNNNCLQLDDDIVAGGEGGGISGQGHNNNNNNDNKNNNNWVTISI